MYVIAYENRSPSDSPEFDGHYTDNAALTASVIPEPSTFIIWSLLATLGITVGWWRRRSRAK
jgi:hypothetical protein